jgi:tetratricopeptide (TPR) repeat protein
MHGRSIGATAGAVVAALAIAAMATPAKASVKNESKLHFDAGLSLVDNEDYAAAAVEFETSVRLYPTKMGLYNLANCYKALRRYGAALDAIERLESEFKGKLGNLTREVKALKETVEGIVGRLDVRVDKDGAAVLVDGADAGVSPLAKPLVLAPGDHIVFVRLEGFESAPQTVRIVAMGRFEVSFIMTPVQEAPPVPVPEPAVAPPAPPQPVAPAVTPAPAAAAPLSAAATAAAPPRKAGKHAAKALGWTSMALGLAGGLVAGGSYLATFAMSEKFQDNRDEYNAAVKKLETQEPTQEVVNDERSSWEDMQSTKESCEKVEKIARGVAIGAGALVATAITLFIVSHEMGHEKRGRPSATAVVTAAPNGVAVEF